MKLSKVLLAMIIMATFTFVSCKSKDSDADIKARVEEAIKADSTMMGTMVADVKEGVVTITGACKDDACKNMCEKSIAGIKGVKSVVNNCTVTPPVAPVVPASLTTVLDQATQQKVKDGLKDIKGVTVEFTGDKAMLSGEVTKADRMKIMQMLASAKVKSDVSKLMDKK
jgi:osmotically-inducible protein OsmY